MSAKLIKKLTGYTGDARLYSVNPPHEGHKHVVVSATMAMFSGPETYIFGADENGEIVDWSELSGSFKGSFDHEEALRNAGYTIAQ